MELPQTLEALHHHLGLLVGLLQQEQESLLHPPQGTEDGARLYRLEQEKQQQFQAIEDLEGQCSELKSALSDAAHVSLTVEDEVPFRREIRDLTAQAVRLHQLNSTLIRHTLVHHQCVLNNLRQTGSSASIAPVPSMVLESMTPSPEPAAPAPKSRSRRRKSVEAAEEQHH